MAFRGSGVRISSAPPLYSNTITLEELYAMKCYLTRQGIRRVATGITVADYYDILDGVIQLGP